MDEIRKNRIRKAMETVLKAFESNPEKVALAVFRGNGKPSDSWSFFNRLIMLMNETEDARGFKQWQKVGRKVKKGAKAFYILAPVKKKVPVKVRRVEKAVVKGEEVTMEIEETVMVEKLVSFKPIPVFRYEDTEGEPLPEENFSIEIPCEFKGIVEELNLKVETTAFRNYYGTYNLKTKIIKLASPELIVFLHELAHAVDDHLHQLNGGQIPLQEVVAEFSAAVIAYLLGYRIPLGNVKGYIESYGFVNLFKAFARVERVVGFVIEKTSNGFC
ncbi:ArdC-like ssDNA-binding domain-containing protein [Archaeoglobus sp.]